MEQKYEGNHDRKIVENEKATNKWKSQKAYGRFLQLSLVNNLYASKKDRENDWKKI